MSLTPTIHLSLPYIDPEPTPSARTAAQSLITASLPPDTTSPHPLLPPLPPQSFSPIMEAEITRIASNTPLTSIDTSRYESLSSTSPTTTLLTQAYTTATYLSTRSTNLALLHQFGKNSWLIGNSQLEDILRGLERELEMRKGEIDGVVIQRKDAQEGVKGEVLGLERAWRGGVGRVVGTEVAGEQVRGEILGRRRRGAV